MALIKCTECGHMISNKANACPNCACPVEAQSICVECGHQLSEYAQTCPQCGCPVGKQATKPFEELTPKGISNKSLQVDGDVQTTDTGYQSEKVIQKHAQVVYAVIIICGFLSCAGCIALFAIMDTSLVVVGILVGLVDLLLSFYVASVARAQLMLYANMSINLHEINTKLR